MNELERTVQDIQNRTETGQQLPTPGQQKPATRLPKTHQDYWLGRLRKRTYADGDGRPVEIPEWQVRLFHQNREDWFNLGTANKSAAAVKARDVYVFLKANGWETAIAKYKPKAAKSPADCVTVGEYLEAAEKTGLLQPRTFLNYQNCLRTVLGGSFGLAGDKSRFDYKTGGHDKWVARLDAIRLSRLTATRLDRWKLRFVEAAGKSPVAIGSARRTVNSYLRCARSLFSRQILNAMPVKQLQLPSPLPFEGVELYRKRDGTVDTGSVRYVSKISAQALIAAANNELKAADPEAYKVFLLGLLAGLRKGEIDLLEWRMLDFENSLIRLEQTEWLHLKTEDSAGDITVDSEVLAELRAFKPRSQSPFVVSGEVTRFVGKKREARTHVRPPRNDSARPYYRCEPVFDRLTGWLRSKGVKANKPLHELRKEVGAMIATQHGIYAASRFLRHSDITTTARHYADQKARITVGLGKLLDTAIKPAPEAVVEG